MNCVLELEYVTGDKPALITFLYFYQAYQTTRRYNTRVQVVGVEKSSLSYINKNNFFNFCTHISI